MHDNYEDAQAYQYFNWQQLAELCNSQAVRILAGQFKKKDDPLIRALKGICTTNTILWQEDHPHPVCILGNIGKITGKMAKN